MPTKTRRELSRTVKADFERLLRQSLNEASGFAECLGLENLAQYLHFVSLDDLTAPEYRNTDICTNHGKAQKAVENPQGMRHTGNSGTSRAIMEVETMEKVKIWAFTANGIGWNRPVTMYFTSREAAENAISCYEYADSIYYAGTFNADKVKSANYFKTDPHEGEVCFIK